MEAGRHVKRLTSSDFAFLINPDQGASPKPTTSVMAIGGNRAEAARMPFSIRYLGAISGLKSDMDARDRGLLLGSLP